MKIRCDHEAIDQYFPCTKGQSPHHALVYLIADPFPVQISSGAIIIIANFLSSQTYIKAVNIKYSFV
jgi:hypothetical protein